MARGRGSALPHPHPGHVRIATPHSPTHSADRGASQRLNMGGGGGGFPATAHPAQRGGRAGKGMERAPGGGVARTG